MNTRLFNSSLGLLIAILWHAPLLAQFSTVINVPPDPAPTSIGSNTQLNLYTGGTLVFGLGVGSSAGGSTNVEFNMSGGLSNNLLNAYSGSTVNISGGSFLGLIDANNGSTMNISGGTIGAGFDANSGSTVNISGGRIGADFDANSGSTVKISGGVITDTFEAKTGSTLHIFGNDLRVNGAPVTGLNNVGDSVPYSPGLLFYVLSGTLADGTPFVFSNTDSDFMSNASITLHAAALPAVGPPTITASSDPIPAGIRGGQSLIVDSGATLAADFNAGWGSSVTIQPGATVGKNFEATGANVTMTGGTVGDALDIYYGAVANISGGIVGKDVDVHGGTLNLSGGKIGSNLDAFDGSTVNVTGGSIGDYFTVHSWGATNISGGEIGQGFYVFGNNHANISGGVIHGITSEADNVLDLYGGDFRINGVPISGLPNVGDMLQTILPVGSVFTGTFSDGTPFVFNNANGDDAFTLDNFGYSTITIHRTTVPAPTGPAVRTASIDGAPLTIREGQTLIVDAGSTLGRNFIAARGSTLIVQPGAIVGDDLEISGATATITGGTFGYGFNAINSTVNISGGTFDFSFHAKAGSVVTITGGTFSTYTSVLTNGTINLQGGTIGDYFQAGSSNGLTTNAHFNVSGGSVGKNMSIFNGATVTISGGSIGDTLTANQGAIFNVTGGTVGMFVTAKTGSTVNISGGTVGYQLLAKGGTVSISGGNVDSIIADTGSTINFSGGDTRSISATSINAVNVSGGLIEDGLSVGSGGTVNVTGGRIGGLGVTGSTLNLSGGDLYASIGVAGGSTFHLYGGDFRLGGTSVSGLGTIGSSQLIYPSNALTGTLADGTPFAFASPNGGDTIASVTLHAAALPSIGPSLITASVGPVPLGIRQGQTLVVDSGAYVPEGFNAGWGSTVIVQPGGVMDHYQRFAGAKLKVAGGSVGALISVLVGSTVDLTAGSIDSAAIIDTGGTINALGGTLGSSVTDYGTLNVVGGQVGAGLQAWSGGVVNVRGGSVGNNIDVNSGATLNLYGGTVGEDFDAASGSFVNLYGSQFLLNGAPIAGLTLNSPFLLTTRNATLTGTLLDGTPFSFNLNSTNLSNQDFFPTSATLKLNLYIAGDINHDGLINTADYITWRKGLGQTFTQDYYNVWRSRFGSSSGSGSQVGGTSAVPEPAASVMFLTASMALFTRRRIFML